MATEKKALLCVFRPPQLKSTGEMREWFSGSYSKFLEMEAVEFKCWWVDQDRGEWGALYIFRSEKELRDYLASDVWQKVVPQKYGCVPQWQVVEPGPILSKAVITRSGDSWIRD